MLILKAVRLDAVVVLFIFQDPGISKMWVWQLGVMVRLISRSMYEIWYVSGTQQTDYERGLPHFLGSQIRQDPPPLYSMFLENGVNFATPGFVPTL